MIGPDTDGTRFIYNLKPVQCACLDPQGINCGKEHYTDEYCSRDFERTPMQWDETENAGER